MAVRWTRVQFIAGQAGVAAGSGGRLCGESLGERMAGAVGKEKKAGVQRVVGPYGSGRAMWGRDLLMV